MKKAFFAFLALSFLTVIGAQAAGGWVRPTVSVSGVTSGAEVDVWVSYSGPDGASGRESHTIRGNGSVKFYDISTAMTRVVFGAQVHGCSACRATKTFTNEVPRSVSLLIPSGVKRRG